MIAVIHNPIKGPRSDQFTVAAGNERQLRLWCARFRRRQFCSRLREDAAAWRLVPIGGERGIRNRVAGWGVWGAGTKNNPGHKRGIVAPRLGLDWSLCPDRIPGLRWRFHLGYHVPPRLGLEIILIRSKPSVSRWATLSRPSGAIPFETP